MVNIIAKAGDRLALPAVIAPSSPDVCSEKRPKGSGNSGFRRPGNSVERELQRQLAGVHDAGRVQGSLDVL